MNQQKRRHILERVKSHQITPEEGVALLTEGVSLSTNNRKTDSMVENLYYQVAWQSKELSPSSTSINQPISILLFDDEHTPLRDQINRQTQVTHQIVLVTKANKFRQLSKDHYSIDPSNPEHYALLLKSLRASHVEFSHIIHYWSKEHFSADQKEIEGRLQSGFYSLFYLCQEILKHSSNKIRLLYVFSHPRNEIQPDYAATGGFLRSVMTENPLLDCKTIDIHVPHHQTSEAWFADCLVKECIQKEYDREIRYVDGRRLVRTLMPYPSNSVHGPSSKLKKNGVYLITGAMGGLGSIFADFLAKEYQAKLILTGRSGWNHKIEQRIIELQDLGAEALYIQADIAQKSAVDNLIQQTKEHFGLINGILHSAGVLRDSFVLKKTIRDIEEVTKPKLIGTLLLSQAVEREELDFFAMFSSTTAFVGNIGQSDYAFANSFMDYYAELKQKSNGYVSINWPFWSNGGMQASEQVLHELKEKLGTIPLTNEKGLQAFSLALEQNSAQFFVVTGIKEKVENQLFSRAKESAADHRNSYLERSYSNESISQKEAEEYVKQILAQEIKLPAHKISSTEPLEVYGIDSVMIVNLNRKLEKHFGQLSKTLLFEYQNVQSLATYFIDNHTDQLLGKIKRRPNHFVPFIAESKEILPLASAAGENTTDLRRAQGRKRFSASPSKSVGSKHAERHKATPEMDDDIAIIGISGRFPQAKNIQQFWDNLKAGKDCITEIPKDRWDYFKDFDPDKTKKGKTYSKWGGFIDHVDKFDPLFFNITPREARFLDPQERIFLETVWHALEDAGYTRKTIDRKTVGTFVGVMYGQYQLFGAEESIKGENIALNSSYASIANRVSYFFNFDGPSIAIDTMCSSSLSAIHLACESIKRGESELAIAGGVNVTIHPNKYILLSQGKFLSSDGRCRSFGDGGDGYVPGEGVGTVILKKLSAALRDGDRIYSVIKGSVINHGGKTNGYTVPNPTAQSNLILQALRRAKVDPRTISYIEAHGTGTSLGDPIEISGMERAFKEFPLENYTCPIGSVKSNIGHLESAAGVAGLIKVLMQMQHRKLVPSIHSEELNPNINFKGSPFYVQRTLTDWEQPVIEVNGEQIQYPRRAAVSSFGAGGSNAHIILEEYVSPKRFIPTRTGTKHLFVLSAQNDFRLMEYVQDFIDYLDHGYFIQTNLAYEQVAAKEKEDVLQVVKKICSQIIDVETDEFEETTALSTIGFDPFLLNTLIGMLNKQFNMNLPLSIWSETTSLLDLVEYIKNGRANAIEEEGDVGTHEDLQLASLAYTLQIGREQMDERLAIMVSSKQELIQKLKEYMNQNDFIPGVFRGNIADDKHVFTMKNDEEDLTYMKALIQEEKFEKLAKLWVTGSEIHWELLYPEQKPPIISLPTYPFARERYWIDRKGEIAPQPAPKLHPLLDENISTFAQQRFKKSFNTHEEVIRDHVISNQFILPGSAYLEMVRAAGELATNKRVTTIESLVWTTPIRVEEPTEVYIDLQPTGQGASFGIYSYDGQDRIQHSQGLIREVSLESPAANKQQIVDIEAIKGRCRTYKERGEIYPKLNEIGFSYGASFQVTEELYIGETEAFSKLILPAEARTDRKPYTMHPALLDGALRTAGAIGEEEKLRVPFALEQLEIMEAIGEECYVYAQLSSESRGTTVKYNIDILSTDGVMLVRIKNFSAREYITPLAKQNDIVDRKPLYYTTEWVEKKSISFSEGELAKSTVLLMDDDRKLYDLMKARYAEMDLYLIIPGREYEQQDKAVFTCNPHSEGDFRTFFQQQEALKQQQIKVISLTAMKRQGFHFIEQNIDEQIYERMFPVITLFKVATELQLNARWLHVNKMKDSLLPFTDMLSGFAKSIATLNYRFQLISLLVDSSSESELMNNLLSEAYATDVINGSEVMYHQGQRFWRQVKPVSASVMQESGASKSLIREKGIYLITGGLGGIGRVLSHFLAKEYKANLILTGRSRLDNQKLEYIRDLEALGASVTYYHADVTKRKDVEEVVWHTRNTFGKIDGVIHLAGSTSTVSVLEADEAQVYDILRPKIHGTIHLDECTKEDQLDFFVMFSSIAALVGDVGVGSYATANRFMDSYAVYRNKLVRQNERRGQTLSINWPFWNADGMELPDTSEAMAYLNYTGLLPLQPEEGIQAFLDALRLNEDQLIIVQGHQEKIERLLKVTETLQDSPVQNSTFTKQKQQETTQEELTQQENSHLQLFTNENRHELLEQMVQYLIGIVAEISDLPLHKMEAKKAIIEYGIDSVMIMEMNSMLEKDFPAIPATLFFEYETLYDVAGYFLTHHLERVKEKVGDRRSSESIANEEHINIENKASLEFSTNPPYLSTQGSRFILQEDKSLIDELESKENVTVETQPLVEGQNDIAIIGVSGRFPGAENLESYWENLSAGKDCITEIPKWRWDVSEFFDPERGKLGHTYAKWGGFIDHIDQFDPAFFNISPFEAEMMDPQERLFLQTAWHTVEDAGYTRDSLSKLKVGVYVGVMYGEYQLYAAEQYKHKTGFLPNSNFSSIANRVSYTLNLRGPSMAIDTACSSSLTAIHLACESIIKGDIDMALAGGVNLSLHPLKYLQLSIPGFFSSDGKCRSFGEGGDGYVPGEGVGSVLLKPLHQAMADGDQILAVIKSTTINHGGRTSGYSVPNLNVQVDLITEALNQSKIDPRSISYMEGQATGTKLGDPIEVEALTKAFRYYTEERQFCALGTAKSSIGHLEAASGIASLCKVILQMKHKKIAPSIHADKLHPHIDFKQSPFYVQRELMDWEQPVLSVDGKAVRYPRRAGISSFGAGGANAHMIIEEYRNDIKKIEENEEGSKLFILSAKDHDRLREYALQMKDFLSNEIAGEGSFSIENFVYTLQIGREHMEERLAVVFSNYDELIEALSHYGENKLSAQNLFVGNTEEQHVNVEMRSDYEIDRLLQEQDFVQLARLWIIGKKIDWGRLYKIRPSKISVPVYPFAQEKYWLPEADLSKQPVPKSALTIKEELLPSEQQMRDSVRKMIAQYLRLPLHKLNDADQLRRLGFDSLTGLRVINALQEMYQIKVSMSSFFSLATIEEIAELLLNEVTQQAEVHELQIRGQLAATLQENQSLALEVQSHPLSAAQKAVWLAHQLAPHNYAYHLPFAFWVEHSLNLHAFQSALNQLIARHAMLRATFMVINDEPLQMIHPEMKADLQVDRIQEQEIKFKLDQAAKLPFNLNIGPLLRVVLFRVDQEKELLLFVFHHLIFDGVSLPIFIQELQHLYHAQLAGQPAQLEKLDSSYLEYVRYQEKILDSVEGQQLRLYWQEKLQEKISPLELPESKTERGFSLEGDSIVVTGNEQLTASLNTFAQENNIPLFIVLFSAYNILLNMYSTQEDLVIGTPMMARPQSKYEPLIGYFSNIVPIRSIVQKDQTFGAFLKSVYQTVLEAMENSFYPFYSLIQDFAQGAEHIVHAYFHFQNWAREFEREQSRLPGEELRVRPYLDLHQSGESNLALEVCEYANQLTLYFKFCPEQYSSRTMAEMVEAYVQILQEIVSGPNRPIRHLVENISPTNLQTTEHITLVGEYLEIPDKCVHELFAEQAKLTPNAIASIYEDKKITFHELNIESDRLALTLQKIGVKKGTFVCIHLERSLDVMIAILGVLKAGAAYVPLDPDYPDERLQYMLEDTKSPVLITKGSLTANLSLSNVTVLNLNDLVEKEGASQGEQDVSLEGKINVAAQSDDVAYVIYTSGSTGKPKGVQVKHRSLVNLLYSMIKQIGITSQDQIMSIASFSFDMSIPEIFLPLVTGGRNEIIPTNISKDGIRLKEKINVSQATIIPATPAMWQMLFEAEWKANRQVRIMTGGEALSFELAQKLNEQAMEVWNLFGPTEATVWVTARKIVPGEKINIGTPLPNTNLYILDQELLPVKEGEVGELYIGGKQLAVGYLNLPEQTKEKFIQNPFVQNSIIYKTGDLVRYLANGTLEYISRVDHQVKIRGYRIELGEIEDTIRSLGVAKEAVAVVREDQKAHKQLVLFVLPSNADSLLGSNEIERLLGKSLPQHMIPDRVIALETIPLTPTKKIDRKWLSSQSLQEIIRSFGHRSMGTEGRAQQVFPSTEGSPLISPTLVELRSFLTRELLKSMTEILEFKPEDGFGTINEDESLGNYGFNSIRYVTLSVKLKKQFNIDMSPALFFEYRTLSQIVNYILEHDLQSVTHVYRQEDMVLLKNYAVQETEDSDGRQEQEEKVLEHEPIAIIGISARLPQCQNVDEFWQRIEAEEDLISDIPAERWDWTKYYGTAREGENKTVSKWGGFLEDVEEFDNVLFNISRREAEVMDPQQRVFLEAAWNAILDSGYRPSDFSGSNTGVFVGVTGSDYMDVLKESEQDIHGYTVSGLARTVIANRVSYLLNLNGPSESIDTACSSSLVSLHRAVAALKSGECKVAIAGGVNLLLSPYPFIALSQNGMMSEDGKCKAFDKEANGYVRGEGVGAVLLKPLKAAEQDGDQIYAVIRGSAVNHDGKSNSLTAPNPQAQADLIVKAYDSCGIDPATVSYIETHGTGTSLGDPIEVNGLKTAFKALGKKFKSTWPAKPSIGIGSVKTNIGHLEGAAGIAGVLKVILSMKHKKIPANIHYKELNPFIELRDSPFYIVQETQDWAVPSVSNERPPRRASVSSFGFGGVNAHIILEEYEADQERRKACATQSNQNIVVLSARTKEELDQYVTELLHDLEQKHTVYDHHATGALDQMAYTLQVGREEYPERLALVAASIEEVVTILHDYRKGQSNPMLFSGSFRQQEFFHDEPEIMDLIAEQDLKRLAEKWVAGSKIPWTHLYSLVPSRMSLPVPPMVRNKFWTWDNYPLFREKNKGNEFLHPMIEKNTSTLVEHSFTTKLNNNRSGPLQYLNINSYYLSGLSLLEMSRAACEIASGQKVAEIKDVVWSYPCLIQDISELRTVLIPNSDDIRFEVASAYRDTEKIHIQGSVGLGERRPITKEHLEFTNSVFTEHLSKSDIASILSSINSSIADIVVEEWFGAQGECFATFQLENHNWLEKEVILHPAVLESVLQVIMIYFKQEYDECCLFAPFKLASFALFDSFAAVKYVHVEQATDHDYSFHVSFLDIEHRILAEMNGFQVKNVVGNH